MPGPVTLPSDSAGPVHATLPSRTATTAAEGLRPSKVTTLALWKTVSGRDSELAIRYEELRLSEATAQISGMSG